MFKQFIALIVLSVLIILFMSYTQEGVQFLVNAHEWMLQVLSDVFSGGQAGSLAKGLIALLSIPFIVGLVPAIAYWTLRRHWFPYFMQVVWVVWLIQAGALIVLLKVAA